MEFKSWFKYDTSYYQGRIGDDGDAENNSFGVNIDLDSHSCICAFVDDQKMQGSYICINREKVSICNFISNLLHGQRITDSMEDGLVVDVWNKGKHILPDQFSTEDWIAIDKLKAKFNKKSAG